MRRLFLLLAMLLSFSASADWRVTTTWGVYVFDVPTLACSDVLPAFTAAATAAGKNPAALPASSCGADPVVVGTPLNWAVSWSGYDAVASLVSIAPTCTAGFHLDVVTNTCVADAPVCGSGFHLDTGTNSCVADAGGGFDYRPYILVIALFFAGVFGFSVGFRV